MKHLQRKGVSLSSKYSSPSLSMSHGARTVFAGTIESNQYSPLTACPSSLALISLQVPAGSSGKEPIATVEREYLSSVKNISPIWTGNTESFTQVV